MPYALIPDGYTLKKVTKAQEDALKKFRRHQDVKTVLGSEYGAPTVAIAGVGATLAIATPILLNLLLDEIDVIPDVNIPDLDKVKETVAKKINIGAALGQGVLQTTLKQLSKGVEEGIDILKLGRLK